MSSHNATSLNRWLAAVTAVACAAALAACGGSGSGSSGATHHANGVTTVAVGIPPVVEIGDLYVAKSRGFFAQQHLAVDIHSLSGGAALVPALQSGALAIGQSNLVSVLQASEHKLGVKCFSGAYRSPSGPELSLLVSPKDRSTITSASALAGKTIAINTLGNANQLVASEYLQRAGVDPSRVQFVALQYPDMPGALAAGRVAAAITDEPFTTIAHSRGAPVLAAQPDSAISAHPAYPCWVANSSWLSANRQAAGRFVAALQQADRYMASHPRYLRSILPQYTSVSASLAKQVVLPHFNTALTAAQVQPWATAAAKFKITGSAVSPSSILDPVPAASG
jgi:NitT/TauT family transport system substrate-binding protein